MAITYQTHVYGNKLRDSGIYHHDGLSGNKILTLKKLVKYDKFNKNIRFDDISSVIDHGTMQVWVLNHRSKIHRLDLSNLESPKKSAYKIKTGEKKFHGSRIIGDSSMVLFDDDIHVIGGGQSSSHYIMNKNKPGLFKKKYTLYHDHAGLVKMGIVTDNKANNIIVMGGLRGCIDFGD